MDKLRQCSAPAAMGTTCDAVKLNPLGHPQFIHCQQLATRRLVIQNGHRPVTVKRCPTCLASLREQARQGRLVIASECRFVVRWSRG